MYVSDVSATGVRTASGQSTWGPVTDTSGRPASRTIRRLRPAYAVLPVWVMTTAASPSRIRLPVKALAAIQRAS
uniref:hypothetical protein n=1 Tax=Paractinoplanes polyasparticus TaxID=2856853 RepID=UPI001C8586C8|nr:hypothetical protein [Actinoplanes polyasparticus]